MSPSGITRYVVTFRYQDKGLAAGLELNSAMTHSGFTTTLQDDDGHTHELGSNSYGIVSAKSAEEVHQQAASIGAVALESEPQVDVQTFADFIQQNRPEG
ncbi:type V toxin-antitoxin system endoribonuclease antitoxin GhoS [Erwinia sp. PK3-005]|uniref:Type V toxin-antitoxin system endoribonuclease antitoxin GhoS n=1 Tax=Mixta hanseatica TaxID=2872648 RepID=A0ABY4RBT8_9GAMM|nr:type V toxin-antitoxin system endoribonuclease antitoxin GhoS [Mixta hanseatica]UQY45891.1 type V toxin-antitoxin system endoribonuclease antitoxin GhoS [Mixta hanseatica]